MTAPADAPPPYWPTAAITAHRKLKHAPRGCDGYPGHAEDELIRVFEKLRDVHGTKRLRCGMALGGDTRAALLAIAYGWELEAHIPGPWQSGEIPTSPRRPQMLGERKRWSEYNQDLWLGLLTYAADTGGVYSYDDGDRFDSRLYLVRNTGLLAGHPTAAAPADVLVAVYDNREGAYSGTYDTFEKGVGRREDGRYRLPVIHIDPLGDESTHLCVGKHCGDCEHAA